MVIMILQEILLMSKNQRLIMPLVKIKDFNALIDYKPFLDQSVKNKQEVNKKLIEMSRNNDYYIQQEIY